MKAPACLGCRSKGGRLAGPVHPPYPMGAAIGPPRGALRDEGFAPVSARTIATAALGVRPLGLAARVGDNRSVGPEGPAGKRVGFLGTTHRHSLVDSGAPLYLKQLVTAHGVEDVTDSKTGYAIVEAQSHDEAVQIFAEHPYLLLHSGNAIELLEFPAAPEQEG